MLVAGGIALTLSSGAASSQSPHNDFGGATPANNPASWVTYRDVLPSLRPRPGRLRLTFDITAEGRVSNCASSEVEALERAVRHFCGLLVDRARFNPALDANGSARQTEGWVIVRWWEP
ncbi:MAG: hypothetical protein H7X93_13170 [Sphingomonadaceae bacterium]|nr:hypothetical protein [Sphingomonadaceae bacterium]